MADAVATPSVPKPTPEYVAAARRGHAKKTPAVSGPPTVGVVFNGGGNRALCGAYGVLRGLQQLKVDGVSALDRIDVMCGNSGGFWATTIFSFACESDHSNETLLEACRSPDPTLVTNAELERLGPKTLGHAATRPTCWQLLCCGPLLLSVGSRDRGDRCACCEASGSAVGSTTFGVGSSTPPTSSRMASRAASSSPPTALKPQGSPIVTPRASFTPRTSSGLERRSMQRRARCALSHSHAVSAFPSRHTTPPLCDRPCRWLVPRTASANSRRRRRP